jgi:S-adenosylmethionine-dependent methyltransferase
MTERPRYGVRMAAVWRQLTAVLEQRCADLGRTALDIVDVGGGSGTVAVALGNIGNPVVVGAVSFIK